MIGRNRRGTTELELSTVEGVESVENVEATGKSR
jgi:hypothetical protein